jgi:ribose 5-phosphate isomerase B
MKIAIGCDQNAYLLKEDIKSYLTELGHEFTNFDVFSANEAVDYPDVAVVLATSIERGKYKRDIPLGGTGIGMAIVANKVRAACCHDPYSAERALKSNNAQAHDGLPNCGS